MASVEKLLCSVLFLAYFQHVHSQTFNCSSYNGANLLINQSSVCDCPSNSFYCGTAFTQRCVTEDQILELCKQPVLAEYCRAPVADNICDFNANPEFILASTKNENICIKKALACACPSGFVPCPGSVGIYPTAAFRDCFAINDFKGSCAKGTCTSSQYQCESGCLNATVPCAETKFSCNTTICGIEYSYQGCASLSNSCPYCDDNTVYSSFACKSSGCSINEISCNGFLDGYCVRNTHLCGPCNDNYFNCPYQYPLRCVTTAECEKCDQPGVSCTTLPSGHVCDLQESIPCGGKCLPLSAACGLPLNCEIYCGQEYSSTCISQIAIDQHCIKCSSASSTDCFSPITTSNTAPHCPEGSFLCHAGATLYCVRKDAICGCKRDETACSSTSGYRCVSNAKIQDACNVALKSTTTTTTTTTTPKKTSTSSTTQSTTTTTYTLKPILHKERALVTAPVAVMGALSFTAIAVNVILGSFALNAVKKTEIEDTIVGIDDIRNPGENNELVVITPDF